MLGLTQQEIAPKLGVNYSKHGKKRKSPVSDLWLRELRGKLMGELGPRFLFLLRQKPSRDKTDRSGDSEALSICLKPMSNLCPEWGRGEVSSKQWKKQQVRGPGNTEVAVVRRGQPLPLCTNTHWAPLLLPTTRRTLRVWWIKNLVNIGTEKCGNSQERVEGTPPVRITFWPMAHKQTTLQVSPASRQIVVT